MTLRLWDTCGNGMRYELFEKGGRGFLTVTDLDSGHTLTGKEYQAFSDAVRAYLKMMNLIHNPRKEWVPAW